MPPRYAYWTILIDGKPTAFRAREQEELLPTLTQLRRTNSDVVMKWFARGRLWDSPEAEREAQKRPPAGAEKRGGDWRPGGAHKDPRDRFKKKNRPPQAWSDKDVSVRRDRDKLGPPAEARPWRDKPAGPPRSDRPWTKPKPGAPSAAGAPRGDRPWSKPPSGPPRGDRPWSKPPSGPPRGDRPWSKPPSGPPRGDRPWSKPPAGTPRSDRPWTDKPGTTPQSAVKPWRDKPAGHPKGDRPWQKKPRDGRAFIPRGQQPPRKRRDDDPEKQ